MGALYPRAGLFAQAGDTGNPRVIGTPFIRNYSPDEYQGDNQNWAIVQDSAGLLYFGNSDGVLEYDGVSWRLLPTTNETVVRSLALDRNNRVYVGAYGEIGYLAPDSLGQLGYRSLLPQLDTQYLDFSNVWQTIATSSGVYFVTQQYIFRWAEERMHVWTAKNSFHVGFSVRDQFYVRQWDVGLLKVQGDSLLLTPGGAQFADKRVYSLLPYANPNDARDTESMLVCTQADGLYVYSGDRLTPFPTAADGLLREALVYHATELSDGGYAFATLKDGVVLVDAAGRLVLRLNKASGLLNDTGWFLYADREGGLWIGSDAGISRVDIAAPLSRFSVLEGLEGSVYDIVLHRGVLYVATSLGTYYWDTAQTERQRFRRVPGVPPQCWSLLSTESALLIGSFEGIFELKGRQAQLIDPAYTFFLHRSLRDGRRVFAGLPNGMKSLYYDGGQWRSEGAVAGIDQEIRDILETPDHQLWLTTRYRGLLRVDDRAGFSERPPVVRYDTAQGLPAGDRAFAFFSAEGLRFGTQAGIYRLDTNSNRFLPDPAFLSESPRKQQPVFNAAQDSEGNVWVIGGEKFGSGLALSRKDDTYEWNDTPFLGIRANYVYPDPTQAAVAWLGSNDQLLRYDASRSKDYRRGFETRIRRVLVNNDSLLFGGTATDRGILLAADENNLRFAFAGLSFADESRNSFQYLLEGYDKDWSKWGTESQKDYTNLPAGSYTFRVRSRNSYQQEGTIAALSFRILPPFYLTWWAYGFYSLAFGGLLLLWRRHELSRVERRQSQRLALLEFNKLKEVDELKSRFFTDISHELRTPLTVIAGMADRIETPLVSQTLILKNSKRLLRLINQMLDLAKLEAGQLQVTLEQADVVAFIQQQIDSFQPFAQSKQITIGFQPAVAEVVMDFDGEKLGNILTNLIFNATKFSNENGRIDLILQVEDRQLVLEIRDNGIGIPPEKLPFIFDRFYQNPRPVHSGQAPYAPQDNKSSGIGLALVKELVTLLGGSIAVSSTLGTGTAFTIKLPIRRDAPVASGTPIDEFDSKRMTPEFFPPIATDQPLKKELPFLLLIEDDEDLATYIRLCLRDHYTVDWVENGALGIERALETLPDMIICDVMMPERNGYEVTRFLKNDDRTNHIPIVLLTAKIDAASRLDGFTAGADAYLAKPFMEEELLVRLERLITLRKSLQAKYSSLDFKAETTDAASPAEAFLEKISQCVLEQLDVREFGAPQLTKELGMSESQLNRKVKALTGQTLSIFVRSVRLREAKTLLMTTELNISEIAYSVGFSEPAYFSRSFSQTFRVSPSQFRKSN